MPRIKLPWSSSNKTKTSSSNMINTKDPPDLNHLIQLLEEQKPTIRSELIKLFQVRLPNFVFKTSLVLLFALSVLPCINDNVLKRQVSTTVDPLNEPVNASILVVELALLVGIIHDSAPVMIINLLLLVYTIIQKTFHPMPPSPPTLLNDLIEHLSRPMLIVYFAYFVWCLKYRNPQMKAAIQERDVSIRYLSKNHRPIPSYLARMLREPDDRILDSRRIRLTYKGLLLAAFVLHVWPLSGPPVVFNSEFLMVTGSGYDQMNRMIAYLVIIIGLIQDYPVYPSAFISISCFLSLSDVFFATTKEAPEWYQSNPRFLLILLGRYLMSGLTWIALFSLGYIPFVYYYTNYPKRCLTDAAVMDDERKVMLEYLETAEKYCQKTETGRRPLPEENLRNLIGFVRRQTSGPGADFIRFLKIHLPNLAFKAFLVTMLAFCVVPYFNDYTIQRKVSVNVDPLYQPVNTVILVLELTLLIGIVRDSPPAMLIGLLLFMNQLVTKANAKPIKWSYWEGSILEPFFMPYSVFYTMAENLVLPSLIAYSVYTVWILKFRNHRKRALKQEFKATIRYLESSSAILGAIPAYLTRLLHAGPFANPDSRRRRRFLLICKISLLLAFILYVFPSMQEQANQESRIRRWARIMETRDRNLPHDPTIGFNISSLKMQGERVDLLILYLIIVLGIGQDSSLAAAISCIFLCFRNVKIYSDTLKQETDSSTWRLIMVLGSRIWFMVLITIVTVCYTVWLYYYPRWSRKISRDYDRKVALEYLQGISQQPPKNDEEMIPLNEIKTDVELKNEEEEEDADKPIETLYSVV